MNGDHGDLGKQKYTNWRTPKKQTYAALLVADDNKKYLSQEQRDYFLFVAGDNYKKLLEDKPKTKSNSKPKQKSTVQRMVAWKEVKDERLQRSKDLQKNINRNKNVAKAAPQLSRKPQLRTLESDKTKYYSERTRIRSVRFFEG